MTENERKVYRWAGQALIALNAGYPRTALKQLDRAARYEVLPFMIPLARVCLGHLSMEDGARVTREAIEDLMARGWTVNQEEPKGRHGNRQPWANAMVWAALLKVPGGLIVAAVPMCGELFKTI